MSWFIAKSPCAITRWPMEASVIPRYSEGSARECKPARPLGVPCRMPVSHPLPRLQMPGVRRSSTRRCAALDGVDLHVHAGEVLALVGENGAGKSTLMKVLSGAHQPDAGTMHLDGKPYCPRGPRDARRLGVAMIYQELSLAPHLSVAENILLGMEPIIGPLINRAEMRRRAAEGLAAVGRSDIPAGLPVAKLSIAAQQLVEVARAVAIGCHLLVLDEPTSSLTQHDIQRLFELVRRLKSQGLAMVYVPHFLEEVRAVCDRVTVLRDGRSVGGGLIGDLPENRIITMMVGRDVHALYPPSARKAGDVSLELDQLQGAKGPRSASLSLRRGQVIGIAGLMGAGRTELLRTVFGSRFRSRSGTMPWRHACRPVFARPAVEAGRRDCERGSQGLRRPHA